MDGEVAAAYRERIGTQINARLTRAALAGKHDVTGHGRPHSAGKLDAALEEFKGVFQFEQKA